MNKLNAGLPCLDLSLEAEIVRCPLTVMWELHATTFASSIRAVARAGDWGKARLYLIGKISSSSAVLVGSPLGLGLFVYAVRLGPILI